MTNHIEMACICNADVTKTLDKYQYNRYSIGSAASHWTGA